MTTNKAEIFTPESTASGPLCPSVEGQICDFLKPDIDSGWRCTVCKEVAQWVQNGAPFVGVREMNPDGVVVFPASRADEVAGALFTLDVALSGESEIRRTLEDVLRVIDNVWIEEQRTQTLLQVKTTLNQPDTPP